MKLSLIFHASIHRICLVQRILGCKKKARSIIATDLYTHNTLTLNQIFNPLTFAGGDRAAEWREDHPAMLKCSPSQRQTLVLLLMAVNSNKIIGNDRNALLFLNPNDMLLNS